MKFQARVATTLALLYAGISVLPGNVCAHLLLATAAVLVLTGSAQAQTAEIRHCTLVGPATMYTRPDGRVWAEFPSPDPTGIIHKETAEVNIWDHYDDPKTKVRWVYITSDDLRVANFWVKRNHVHCGE
jgi:hypothetical protein